MDERARARELVEAARAEAAALVESLRAAKAELAGCRDPYRVVTGASSIDNALAQAERVVAAYDRARADVETGRLWEEGSGLVVGDASGEGSEVRGTVVVQVRGMPTCGGVGDAVA
jgi:hypothetical protein